MRKARIFLGSRLNFPSLFLRRLSWPASNPSRRLTRMFGKAVKIRHCPATVSATQESLVVWRRIPRESGQMPLRSLHHGDAWEGGSEWRKSGDRSLVPLTWLTFRGERRIPMSFDLGRPGLSALTRLSRFCAAFFLLSATFLHAGVIRGTVTDTSGATVVGATIVLMNGAKYVGKTVSTADGSYQLVTGQSGRFSLVITAQSF